MAKIITIGREFGSGGRELGRRLAEALGYEYYDKEIITEISKRTKMSEDYVQDIVEQRPHRLFPITIGQSIAYGDNMAYQQIQEVYLAQADIIKELAMKSPCVIVGRCADDILADFKPFRLFVYAEMPSKIKRCQLRNKNSLDLSEKRLAKDIKNIDKQRAKYYEHYTNKKWGDIANYDLCINTTNVVIKDLVPILAKMFKED